MVCVGRKLPKSTAGLAWFAASFLGLAQNSGTSIRPAELDRAIEDVIHQPQYAWRLPRQYDPAKQERGRFVTFTVSVLKAVGRWTRAGGRLVMRFVDWLGNLFRPKEDVSAGQPGGAGQSYGLLSFVILLLAAIAVALGYLVRRSLRLRAKSQEATLAPSPEPIDLESASIVADQLPEEGWIDLARQSIERNELRMAIRALYLAGLAILGRRELVLIHRAKSNHDYQTELDRRARALPALSAAFSQNVTAFESVWYGQHPAGRDEVDLFFANLNCLRTNAE